MSSVLDALSINTIRTLSIDAVQKANSGHPGMPLGTAAMAHVVWTKFLRFNPADPQWPNRDRFVLSAGHGSMLLYSLLYLSGFGLTLDDLKQFRQWGSRTPGHPESHLTPGVEVTTGPLGQGVGTMAGMAIAREQLAAWFNSEEHELFNYRVFGICSDGDLMEGVGAEAASLAGHLGLGSIVLLYDDNRITIDGSTEITFSEDVGARFAACGWHVLNADGLNPDDVEQAVQCGIDETERPTLIRCRTVIGYGSPNKAGSAAAHGAPLGEEEVRKTKEKLGVPADRFFDVPPEVLKHYRTAVKSGKERQEQWNLKLEAARGESSDFAAKWDRFWNGGLPEGWADDLPVWTAKDKPLPTRKASHKIIQTIAPKLPGLVGGSADLAESNLNYMDGFGDFQKDRPEGRNLRFGIREHVMGTILNGLALSGPFIPHGATFFNFLDYMKPAVRIAAMSKLRVIYIFTHDSIGLGEDGPTHQPVEHLWHLRATPNLWTLRPADANETRECWKLALERTEGPSALILTRQSTPVIDPDGCEPMQVQRGGYILAEADGGQPEVILLATGSEVVVALSARELLQRDGIPARVVSMPCLELFDEQPEEYRQLVLPPEVRNRFSIEAGATAGWWKYVGMDGDVLGIDRFGASAPSAVLFEKFGFTAENTAARVKQMMERNRQRAGVGV